MKYRIKHKTVYSYSSPVRVCHNYVMLTPRNEFPVKTHASTITIKPFPQVSQERQDAFGNTIRTFSIEENHKQLSVLAESVVTISKRSLPSPESTVPWEEVEAGIRLQEDPNWLPVCQFVYNSQRIRRSNLFRDFALKSFQPNRPILKAAIDFNSRIHKYFKYDTESTNVMTTPEEAFKSAAGVCQDFAHVQLACLRSIGLPARYMSGYLRTIPAPGKERLIGQDQSHAWISLYCGEEIGWVDFDATNNCLPETDHIPIAWGRDYSDVAPFKGVFLGGGDHHLSVSVDVVPFNKLAEKSDENRDPGETSS
ncbi:transglutaminase family protein [Planctomicrobium sp. SH668]|uniref:transglutaminase family protein n=1 Tax=Planctomicrobium sp. SH668 TaxID=3448126 RepID=UPI003F5C0EE3